MPTLPPTAPLAGNAAVPPKGCNRLARLTGQAVAGGLALCLLALVACSGPVPAPGGLFGLTFGDGPPAGLVAQTVPLPAGLSGRLAFFTAPGRRETAWEAVLADPVLAYYEGRLFSIDAVLADAAAVPGLRRRLTRDYGSPHCRDLARQAACLWQAGEVEMILESGGDGPARLMVRHRQTAGAVAAAMPQAPGGVRGDGPPDGTAAVRGEAP
ncbi:hypothetical protein [Solidesulfovibrio sp.]